MLRPTRYVQILSTYLTDETPHFCRRFSAFPLLIKIYSRRSLEGRKGRWGWGREGGERGRRTRRSNPSDPHPHSHPRPHPSPSIPIHPHPFPPPPPDLHPANSRAKNEPRPLHPQSAMISSVRARFGRCKWHRSVATDGVRTSGSGIGHRAEGWTTMVTSRNAGSGERRAESGDQEHYQR